VRHTSLEAHEGSQVASLGLIILREGTDATSVVLCALLVVELQRAKTGVLEFTVRHGR